MTTPNDLREKLTAEFIGQDHATNGEGLVKLEDQVDAALSVFRPYLEELGSLRARVAELEGALSEIWMHFEAADAEGLQQQLLNNGNPYEAGDILGLVIRRLLPAFNVAREALKGDAP